MSAQDTERDDPADDEIIDPGTGEADGYVLALGDANVPLPQRKPELATAPANGDFPLWPAGGTAGAVAPAELAGPPSRAPRRPVVGLPLLVVLGLLTAFFAWVGAEPAWLALGHADRGTLTVTDCVGGGIAQRCTGTFVAAGNRYTVKRVAVSGAPDTSHPGTHLSARMVDANGRSAYAGDHLGLVLRWAVPLGLILVFGLLIALFTGARRLRGKQRAVIITLSLAGPLFLTAGILAVTR